MFFETIRAKVIESKLRDFFVQMKKQNISAHAGSTAFFVFVSLLPMLITICTIIPFTPLTEANLERAITDLLPDMIDPLAVGLVRQVYEKSAGVLSVAAIVTQWSAGKGVLALMRGLNDINDVEDKRSYFHVRLVASGYTLLLLFVVLLSMLVLVIGNEVLGMLTPRFPQLGEWKVFFRFGTMWVLLTLFFALIYTYIPVKKMKMKAQFVGAMLAAALWSVFSWGFSLYVDRGLMKGIYGNLSTVAIIMLWLYFGIYILFAGACLNRCFVIRRRFCG